MRVYLAHLYDQDCTWVFTSPDSIDHVLEWLLANQIPHGCDCEEMDPADYDALPNETFVIPD